MCTVYQKALPRTDLEEHVPRGAGPGQERVAFIPAELEPRPPRLPVGPRARRGDEVRMDDGATVQLLLPVGVPVLDAWRPAVPYAL